MGWVLSLSEIDPDPDVPFIIDCEIHDGDGHIYKLGVNIDELEVDSDHVLTWFNTKYVNGGSWLSTCSNVTEVSFHMWRFFNNDEDVGSDDLESKHCNIEINKCGIWLVYMNDLEKFADSESQPMINSKKIKLV